MSKPNIINVCPNCGVLMEWRKHKKITEKILAKPYYFKQWAYCNQCNYLQHFEDEKIYN